MARLICERNCCLIAFAPDHHVHGCAVEIDRSGLEVAIGYAAQHPPAAVDLGSRAAVDLYGHGAILAGLRSSTDVLLCVAIPLVFQCWISAFPEP